MSLEQETYEGDLTIYESSSGPTADQLEGATLLYPVRRLSYLKEPAMVESRTTVAQALETMNEH